MNLKKAQMDPMAPPAAPASTPEAAPATEAPQQGNPTQGGPQKFGSGKELADFAKNKPMDQLQSLSDGVGGMDRDHVLQLVDELVMEEDDIRRESLGNEILMTNPSLRTTPEKDPLAMTVPHEHVRAAVEQSSQAIQKLAQESAKNSKTFNFQKYAQSKSLQNFLLWGPESKRVDSITGQIVSDWHIIERNKGWGFNGFDDAQTVDYETFWRQNIMDKYYRPYRDKDGNWVGGYIEKRFEVDKWIPEQNNYQLPPNETRRARPASQGLIEARLQDQRSKGGKNDVTSLSFEPNDSSKPFNWLEASSKKKTSLTASSPTQKEAYIGDIKTPDFGSKMKGPMKAVEMTPKSICRKCGNYMNKDNVCESCGNVGNAAVNGVFEKKPMEKGDKQNNPYSLNQNSVVINPNQNLSLNGRVKASVYDSRTDKFVTAQMPPDPMGGGAPPMGGPPAPPPPPAGKKLDPEDLLPEIEKKRKFRHRHVRYDSAGEDYPEFESKDFKMMTKPKSQEMKPLTDHPNRDDSEVADSADDLCIDG